MLPPRHLPAEEVPQEIGVPRARSGTLSFRGAPPSCIGVLTVLLREPRCLVFKLDRWDLWEPLRTRRGFYAEERMLEEIRTSGEVEIGDHILLVSEKPSLRASEWLLRPHEHREHEWVRLPVESVRHLAETNGTHHAEG